MEEEFKKYFKLGEILKPEFDNLKKQWNRVMEKEYRKINETILGGVTGSIYSDLYYFHPTVSNIKFMKKKMKNITGRNKYEKDVIAFYERYAPVGEDFDRLSKIVKTTTRKREETKEREKEEFARSCYIDPLTKALMVHHDEYVRVAGEISEKQYDSRKKYLEENGGIDKVAPEPTYNISKFSYVYAKEKREFYSQFLRLSKSEFVRNAEESAHVDYRSWVVKMASKVGKNVVSANMKGDPWESSTLVVVTDDGEKQVWNTRMIINHSKYGKVFHQFPSRRIDE